MLHSFLVQRANQLILARKCCLALPRRQIQVQSLVQDLAAFRQKMPVCMCFLVSHPVGRNACCL